MGNCLKFVPGGDGVGQANSLFVEVGGRDAAKPGAEHGPQVPGPAGADHVGDDYTKELFRHMHTPMQLYILAYLRAIYILGWG